MRKKLITGAFHLALFLVLAGILDNARSLCFPSQHEPWYDIHAYFDSLRLQSNIDRARFGALEIRLRVAETAIRQIAIETEIQSFDTTVASFGAAPDSFTKSPHIYGNQNNAGIRYQQPTLLCLDLPRHPCNFCNVQYRVSTAD